MPVPKVSVLERVDCITISEENKELFLSSELITLHMEALKESLQRLQERAAN